MDSADPPAAADLLALGVGVGKQHGHVAIGARTDFLRALGHGMPSGSGIALGFDRLAMLASGARRVADVLWLPTAEPDSA